MPHSTGCAPPPTRPSAPADLGELEITVTPRGRLTAETAAAFAALGVHRLVVIPNPKDGDVRPSIEASIGAVAGL